MYHKSNLIGFCYIYLKAFETPKLYLVNCIFDFALCFGMILEQG